jgi:hypothetical protein
MQGQTKFTISNNEKIGMQRFEGQLNRSLLSKINGELLKMCLQFSEKHRSANKETSCFKKSPCLFIQCKVQFIAIFNNRILKKLKKIIFLFF